MCLRQNFEAIIKNDLDKRVLERMIKNERKYTQ